MTPQSLPLGFSLSQLKGFFPASSGIQSQNSFRVEGAGKSPKVLSGIPPSGVTRSHSVQILDF